MSGGKPATNTVHVKYRKIHTSDLKYDDKFLERGTYGDVKKATWQDKNVAVKMFPYAERKGGFSEELVCLTMLHEHAYIVNLHGAHLGNSQTDRPFLVLEFAPYSLEKVLHRFRDELKYTVDNVMSWTLQMVIALEFIHSKDMLHRDIKPSNILLFEDGRVLKLCDFGTARKLEHTLTNAVGTSWYMAPEVIRGTSYMASCDVYSFGVVLWEMITRHKPYLAGTQGKSMAPQSVMYRVATGGRPPMIARLPKCLEELIKKCWDEGSHKRPTFREIMSKLERLVKMIKIEPGRPFIRCRVKTTEEAESGAGQGVEQEAEPEKTPSPEKTDSDSRKRQGSTADTQSSLSHSSTPGSSASPRPSPPPRSTPSPTSPSSHVPPSPSSHVPPSPSSHIPPSPSSHIPPSPSAHMTPSPSSHIPPSPSSHIPPSPSAHMTPSQSTPSLPSAAHRPTSIPKLPPSSSHSRLPHDHHVTPGAGNYTTAAELTRTERLQLYKQQSSPAGEGGHLPEAPPTSSTDPLSSSYPQTQLSPFMERRRLGRPSTPVSHTPAGQFRGPSTFSPHSTKPPIITHQDSVAIEREGEEEDVVSQKQRQQWFQQVEEKSKSGEWDDGSPPPPHLSIYPTAIPGTHHYSIPGLHPDWQPVVPDSSSSDSLQFFHNYKEVAQQFVKTSSELANLTEICAKLDQEIRQDEVTLEKNKPSKDHYQKLLNQKDTMVSELQRIKGQLTQNRTRRY